ncbi:hypothetical protein KAZ82_02470, partial [Candidatus Babeliales bacterium]|nr:hypothetical protein [Candidatus Babeliales bacterium]
MKKLSILGLLLFANANIAAMEKGVTVPSTDGGTEEVDILSVLLDDAVVYLVETNGEVGTVENFWNNIIPRVIEEYIIPERQQEFLERVAELKL